MKKITLFCVSLFTITSTTIIAQSGAKYATGGNATNPGDVLGTTNSQPLNFVTNNVLRMVLDVNGQLKVVNLAGTGSRFLQSDTNGNLISFPAGNSNEVLYGNGVWGALPAGATSWQIAGNNLLATNTGNVGIGTNTPIYKLDVIGDVRVSNNLYVGGGIVITDKVQAAHEVTTMTMRADSIKMDASKAIYGTTRIEGDIDAKNKMDVQGNATFNGTLKNTVLAGGGDKIVYADINGNLKMGPGTGGPGGNGGACVFSMPWFLGGNSILGSSIGMQSIGTCNNYDFVLKSNNNESIFLKPNGYVGIGINNLNPLAALDITDPSYAGDHFRIFANPSGDVEATSNLTFNYAANSVFGINEGPIGSNNFHMYITGGNIGFGTTTPYKKLTVQGDVSLINYGSGAGTGANGFEILGNSQVPTRRGISLEPDPDGDVCFFIHNWQSASGLPEFRFKNGINFATNTQAQNYAGAPDLMVIDGLGLTTIHNYYSSPNDNALIVKDGNSNTINFSVKKSGKLTVGDNSTSTSNAMVSINSSNNEALSVQNAVNGTTTFKIAKDGYTEINIHSGALLPGNRVLSIFDVAGNKDIFAIKNDGKVYSREVEITLVNNFPDYVFSKDYKLKTVPEVAEYISKNKHLPGFEKGEYYEKNGINVNTMFLKQQEKIEELMLYIIELEKRLKAVEANK